MSAAQAGNSPGALTSLSSSSQKVTMPNGSTLPAPAKGKGSVPREQRDKKRGATKEEKQEMLDERGNKCEGCDKPATPEDVAAHHSDTRWADGGGPVKDNLVNLCPQCHALVHGQKPPPLPHPPVPAPAPAPQPPVPQP